MSRNKRWLAWFLAAVLCLAPMGAWAEGGEEAPPAEMPEAGSFAIDTTHVYAGMDRAYQSGYTPTVKNGTASVVLPLLAENIQGNSITVTPNLGDPATAPFVFRNYQKVFTLAEHPVSGGGKAACYLVQFDFALQKERMNGVYPVVLEVQAKDSAGNAVLQSFTAYVTVSDGKSAADAADVPADAPATDKPTSQPIIVVEKSVANPSPVQAGGEFSLAVTLRNTNKQKLVQNMTVAVTCDNPSLTLLNDSSTIYIDKIAKGGAKELELRYRIDPSEAMGKANITLTMAYDNSDAATLNSVGVVTVDIAQPMRVSVSMPQIPSEVNAGDTLALAFQVMNLGRGKVYNVRLEISAPGFIPDKAAFIGNMEPGSDGTADVNVFIGTRDMSEGSTETEKYGMTSGAITLKYEDENGQEYQEEFPISTNILEPFIPAATEPETPEETKTPSQWWIFVAAGAAVIAGAAAFLIVRKKRRGKGHDEV